MEIIKDFLTLFLQLTAIQVLLVTSWPIRKPKLRLATAIFVLNIDLALRSKIYSAYGDCKCLSNYLNRITKKPDSDHERILFGYRAPLRGLDVIKEISEWESTQYTYGPVVYLQDDDERRWESELKLRKYQLGIGDEQRSEIAPEYRRGPIDRLHEVIREKYGYELGKNLESGEDPVQPKPIYYEDEQDLLAMILAGIEKECPNDMERVKAINHLTSAYKVINIVQLKNSYHASISNIHLLISNEYRGVMKLVTEFAEKQGFSITVNTTQNVHLALGELPPNSERYCILETRLRPLTEKDIKMQSNLLLDKLSPQKMRFIIITAILITLITLFGSEVANNFQLLLLAMKSPS